MIMTTKPIKTIVKISRKKSGTVNVSEDAIKLFDAANKRIARLEKFNTENDGTLKRENISSFHNSARAITRGKSKKGILSKSRKMDVAQYNAQVRLARKIVNDKTMTVAGAKKEDAVREKNWMKKLSKKYPELSKSDIRDLYDELIKYNQDNYEDSYFQFLYQSWKENEHSERDRGLIQLLNAGKAHGMSVKDSLTWLDEHARNDTWHSLSNKYLKQWEKK